MTGVVNSQELGPESAQFGCTLLRQVFVDFAHDEFAEIAVQCSAQEAKQIRCGDKNNPLELCVDAPVFEAPGNFARELGGLLVSRRVRVSKRMSIGGTARSVARQIALMCPRFGVNEIFEFLQRTPGCCDGKDARA
jgi:hypothetical protein